MQGYIIAGAVGYLIDGAEGASIAILAMFFVVVLLAALGITKD